MQMGIGLGVGLYNEKNDKVSLEGNEDGSGVVTPVVMLKKGTYDIVVSMRGFSREEEQVKVVVYTSMSGVTLTGQGH